MINFTFRWEKKCFCQIKLYVKCIYTCILPLKNFIPYFVAVLVLSGTALSIKFSISWSEISANGRDAIVSFFPQGDSCQSDTGSFVIGRNR